MVVKNPELCFKNLHLEKNTEAQRGDAVGLSHTGS